MSEDTGKWKSVKKSKKKNKKDDSTKTKSNIINSDIPFSNSIYDPLNLIEGKEEDEIYDDNRFMKKSKKEEKKVEDEREKYIVEFAEDPLAKTKKKGKKKKSESNVPKKKSSQLSLEEAMSALYSIVNDEVDAILQKYRNNHIVRLQTIAEKLERVFADSSTNTKNQLLPSKLSAYEASDFPLSLIPKDIVQKLEPFVQSVEQDDETKMCTFLLTTLLVQEDSTSRGLGIKLLLQLMLKNSPELIEVSINDFKKEFKKRKSETRETTKNILFYVFWQLAKGSDPSYSLLFFIHFADIFLKSSNKEDLKRIVSESVAISDKDRHFLLDKDGINALIQSTTNSCVNINDENESLKNDLCNLLLNIIKTEPNSDKYTENLLTSLSSLLMSDNEVSDQIDVYKKCISYALLGRNGFKIWGNQYVKNFESSLRMLEYIQSNNLLRQYDADLVTKFLNGVIDKNESALQAKYGDRSRHRAGLQKKSEDDLHKSNKIASQLLHKYGIQRQITKSKPASPGYSGFIENLSLLLMFIAMVGIFYLIYQVSLKTNVIEQFENSLLVRFIKNSPYYKQFIDITKPYYNSAIEHVTPYWNLFMEHFNPLYNEAKTQVITLWNQFLKHFIPIYNQAIEKLKPLVHQAMIKMETIYNEILKYFQEFVKAYVK